MKTLLKTLSAAALATLLSTSAHAEETETLLGFVVGAEGISYQVYSGGCTSREDFQVYQLETFPVQLRLVRTQPDYCEAYMPYGTTIQVTWDELGIRAGTEFVIGNPVDTRHYVY